MSPLQRASGLESARRSWASHLHRSSPERQIMGAPRPRERHPLLGTPVAQVHASLEDRQVLLSILAIMHGPIHTTPHTGSSCLRNMTMNLTLRQSKPPKPCPSLPYLHKGHVDFVNIWPLLTIHFDAHKVLAHNLPDFLVLEGLLLHHMAPVAGGVANCKQAPVSEERPFAGCRTHVMGRRLRGGTPRSGEQLLPPWRSGRESPPVSMETFRASWALQLLLLKSGQGLW